MTIYPDVNEPLLGLEDLPWGEYDSGPWNDVTMPEALLVAPGLGSRIFMASALSRYPEIEMIGPEFFTFQWASHDASWYGDHIKKHAGKTVIDASESLVFLPSCAIEKIKTLKPDLRIVMVLQNPWALCQEFIQNRFFYHKGVFAKRDLYLDDVQDSMILECLIRDDVMTRIDYEALVLRWTSVFPASRVFVGYLENTAESTASCVKNAFDFIMPGESFDDQPMNGFQALAYGNGLNLDRPHINDVMDDIINHKLESFHHFLNRNNLPVSPWIIKEKTGHATPVYVEKRKNWRIHLKEGTFQGVHGDSDEVLESGFLGDIRRMVSAGGTENGASVSAEDARLCSILNEIAKHSAGDKRKTERMNQIAFIEHYYLYNILKTGGRFIAIRQAMGPVSLFREKLGEREISPYLLRAETIEAVKRKVDLTYSYKESVSGNKDIVEHWL